MLPRYVRYCCQSGPSTKPKVSFSACRLSGGNSVPALENMICTGSPGISRGRKKLIVAAAMKAAM